MIITRTIKYISRIFTDENLTKKAYLNFINNSLTYVVKIGVQFIITPLMVAGLGSYVYGLWQVINRTLGYLTSTSGRPTDALLWMIARNQTSDDYDLKRQYMTSSIIVWAIFIPLMIVCGSIIVWFIPSWFDVRSEYVSMVRITALILIAGMVVQVFSELPQSILRGENLGYKRMGLAVLLTIVGGLGTWVALALHTGIIGIAAVTVISTMLNIVLYLFLARRYIPWFGISRPPRSQVKEFFGLSSWFMGSNLVWSAMLATDVVLLGMLTSVEMVTIYTLTKYVPEILISLTQFITAGIGPGLGAIIGRGEIKRAAELRGEIMSICWLIGSTVGFTVLIWNQTFLNLWVGESNYAGSFVSLLIVLAVLQFVMIQSDANVIDVTLKIGKKVILGLLSIILTVISAIVLIRQFHLAIAGIALSLILGRIILSIGYPLIVGKSLQISITSQLKGAFRPFTVAILLLILGFEIGKLIPFFLFSGIQGWTAFLLVSGVTYIFVLIISFYLELTATQRSSIIQRVKIILKPRS